MMNYVKYTVVVVFAAINVIGRVPAADMKILKEVAKEYSLTKTETRLLVAVRIFENGGKGIEMGVGADYKNHPARRYAGNPSKSLRLQAQWAAGTIKKRYRGSTLAVFAKRYCPPNHVVWSQEVTKIMKQLEKTM